MAAVTVNLVGTGRVGRTLARRIADDPHYQLQDLASSSTAGAQAGVEFAGQGRATGEIGQMRQADLWLLTVPDDQIATVARQIAATLGGDHAPSLVAHCSGCLSSDELRPLRDSGWSAASAHPVLSFADPARAAAGFAGTFCGIEGDDPACAAVTALMSDIGARPFRLNPADKAIYHAAAVFSNNFTVVLQAIALEAWVKAGVPKEIAHQLNAALLAATVANVMADGPQKALTGPAARGDMNVIIHQGAAVSAWNTDAGAVYTQLSRMAQRLKRTGSTAALQEENDNTRP